jgi:hypothetical protein
MLLALKDLKDKYAIGLRWAVDTRSGIEEIQYECELNYGFILPLQGADKKSKMKFVALTDKKHNKYVGLAGLLCHEYENLIFIHRVDDHYYWLCVIKNHEIWMGVDIQGGTAGDYVGDLQTVKHLVNEAKQELGDDAGVVLSEGSDPEEIEATVATDSGLDGVLLCSDTAWEEFRGFTNVNFIELILRISKFKRAYVVRYLESSRARIQQALLFVLILAGIVGVGYYFIHVKHVQTALVRYAQEQQLEKMEAKKRKAAYYVDQQRSIQRNWGYNAIANLLYQFQYLTLESEGWKLVQAKYDTSNPNGMVLTVVRSDYGTVNSFLKAYAGKGHGKLSNSNNQGVKNWKFQHRFSPTLMPKSYTVSQLTAAKPQQRYDLISYMQLAGASLHFEPGREKVSNYGVSSTRFNLSGESLWKLKEAQLIFKQFPTLTVETVDLTTKGYDMSWTLEGTIYV